jgi:hypothetical protein
MGGAVDEALAIKQSGVKRIVASTRDAEAASAEADVVNTSARLSPLIMSLPSNES